MTREEAVEAAAEAIMKKYPSMTADYTPPFFRKLAETVLDAAAKSELPGEELCAGCEKPPPREWCWAGWLTGCPSGMPPKYLTVEVLWRLAGDLQRRIERVERLS